MKGANTISSVPPKFHLKPIFKSYEAMKKIFWVDFFVWFLPEFYQ